MGREDKRRQNQFDNPLVVGIVGHVQIEELPKIKKYFEELEGFRLVFFKTSTGKLYIKEGEGYD